MFTCNKNYPPELTFKILSLTIFTFVSILTSLEMNIFLEALGTFQPFPTWPNISLGLGLSCPNLSG